MNILRFVIPKCLVEHITTDSTVRQALEKMTYHKYAAIPVLDKEGRYAGVVRNYDLMHFFLSTRSFDKTAADDVPVTEIMQSDLKSVVSHSDDMDKLIECVTEHNFAPVTDDRGCFIGIILRRDVLNFLHKFYNENEDD